ncbi:MAG: hypothetical protein J0I29_05170, partial [Rhizobiales bacterium]|nr:hypothetical protein [Hyphomicrobiales bacterium]
MAKARTRNVSDLPGVIGGLMPLWIGAGVYLFVLATGNNLLRDSDIFWQIEVGRWIAEHRAVPY